MVLQTRSMDGTTAMNLEVSPDGRMAGLQDMFHVAPALTDLWMFATDKELGVVHPPAAADFCDLWNLCIHAAALPRDAPPPSQN